jgi:hypothetical protein
MPVFAQTKQDQVKSGPWAAWTVELPSQRTLISLGRCSRLEFTFHTVHVVGWDAEGHKKRLLSGGEIAIAVRWGHTSLVAEEKPDP